MSLFSSMKQILALLRDAVNGQNFLQAIQSRMLEEINAIFALLSAQFLLSCCQSWLLTQLQIWVLSSFYLQDKSQMERLMLSSHLPNLACIKPSRIIIISALVYFSTILRLFSFMVKNTICHQENSFLCHGGGKERFRIVQQQ